MSSTVIAGKPSNTIGEKDSVLVLRGSSVRVLWGNKFIDLIKNGKINVELDKLLKTVNSVDNIKGDGIYLIEDQVWLALKDAKVLLAGDKSTVYVSFVESLETTEENKLTALKNIGFYYNTIEEALLAGLLSGIIYVLGDNKLYTIINGLFSEYFFLSDQKEQVEESIIKTLYINENSLWVDDNEYIKCENNLVTILKQLIIEEGIYSQGSNINTGYKLYIKDGRSYLEVDEVIERDPSALTAYEFVKIFSEHSNIVLETLPIDNDIQCILLENNLFKTNDYIYIVGNVEVNSEYENGIISITLNKLSSVEIRGTLNDTEIIIPAGTTLLYIAGPSDYKLKLNIEKELFEYKIKNSENLTILVENGDSTFYKNCKYVYSSRKPLIKIHKNNLSVVDRSILIDDKPDETIHTKIGIVEEDSIELLKEEFKELEDRPKVGIYSDNFIGLNPLLYNVIFKSTEGLKTFGNAGDLQRFPEYENITIPNPSLGNPGQTEELKKIYLEKKLDLVVPNIEWIKALIDFAIPIGTIVAWSGNTNNIPKGWVICTELLDKFIVGSNENKVSTVGTAIDKDGKVLVDIESKHLPNHVHNIEAHTHNAETVVDVRDYTGSKSDTIEDDYRDSSSKSISKGDDSSVSVKEVSGYSSETETVSIDISHGHSASAKTTIYKNTEGLKTTNDRNDWGNKTKLDVTPIYYKLIFIKKVSSSFE